MRSASSPLWLDNGAVSRGAEAVKTGVRLDDAESTVRKLLRIDALRRYSVCQEWRRSRAGMVGQWKSTKATSCNEHLLFVLRDLECVLLLM